MTGKLVSVIIPTYNGEKFIAETLNSIINQDYENLEIILVDDVSTDNTVKISREILENSGRKFQLIQRTVNGRQSASRNTGLDASNGEYVIFVDHDDLTEKNFVSSLYKEIEDKNADLVFCGFRCYYKDEDRYENPENTLPKEPLPSSEDYIKAWTKREINLWSIWNYIFRKDFLIKNKLRFFEKIYIFEDLEFILKAVSLCSRMSYIKDVLYTYIYHPSQQSKTDPDLINRTISSQKFNQIVIAQWRAGRCILKHTKDKGIRNYIFAFYIAQTLVKYCTLCAKDGERERYNRLVKTLHHKKIRKIMFSTIKYIRKEPELFFKALMVLYCPNFYYKLRLKKTK